MNFNLNSKFEDYINNLGNRFVTCVKPIEPSMMNEMNSKGNMEQLPILDIRDQIVDEPIRSAWINQFDEHVNIVETYNGVSYGFDETDFIMVKKLVKRIDKIKEVQMCVSSSFVFDTILNWIFARYRGYEINNKLIDYLNLVFTEAKKTYDIYLHILHLDIENNFSIGGTKIMYFSKTELDAIELKFNKIKANPDASISGLIDFLKGKVFAKTQVSAEIGKAQEIAFNNSSIAIDCLRICSPVMYRPYMKSDFDLEKRPHFVLEENIITQEVGKDSSFIESRSSNTERYLINRIEFDYLQEMNLGLFNLFLLNKNQESELEQLIIQSINAFAEALKDRLYQRRISKIFSIFESLILQNEEEGILNSLVKYVPKLIFEKLDDRKEIIRLLKEFYKIRSAFVHHSKLKEFKYEELRRFQIGLVMLIINLIKLSEKYSTKAEIINRIEDQIIVTFKISEELKNQ